MPTGPRRGNGDGRGTPLQLCRDAPILVERPGKLDPLPDLKASDRGHKLTRAGHSLALSPSCQLKLWSPRLGAEARGLGASPVPTAQLEAEHEIKGGCPPQLQELLAIVKGDF